MKLIICRPKEEGPQSLQGPQRKQAFDTASTNGVNNNLFRKCIFDTKNHFYYTEIWKEKYRPKY